jgi:protein phosphatase
MLRFEVFARTEVGCARERNEDSFLVLNLATGESGLQPQARIQPLEPPGTILGVCDGMGGAAAGDVAARIALDALDRVMRERTPLLDVDTAEVALLAVVTTANRAVLDHAKQHPEKRGMGTTMTVATLFGPDVVIVQVGDSRAYVRRGNMLQQLTMDQNVVGQMIATGRLSPEQARTAKQRNMLLEAIGVQERVGPDIVRVRVQAGDVLMLCSDGLTGPLEDRKVLELLLKHPEPVKACRALTEAACAHGGPDNVTVAIAKVLGDPGDSFAPEGPIEFTRRPAVA